MANGYSPSRRSFLKGGLAASAYVAAEPVAERGYGILRGIYGLVHDFFANPRGGIDNLVQNQESLEGGVGHAHAQEPTPRSALPKSNSIDFSKYKTINDILNDSPYFKKIKFEDVRKEITHGKGVLFLYDKNDVAGNPNKNMLLLWKVMAAEFPDIRFLALEYEGPSRHNDYQSIGLSWRPAYALFSNGKTVFVQTKGPTDEELAKSIETSRRNLEELRKM